MKAFFLHSALLLTLIALAGCKNICNADLLYSYGVTNPHYVTQTSLLCQTGEPETCCNNNDESNMLSRWNERDKNYIKPYYQAIIWLMKGIFNYYEDVIVKAKYLYLDSRVDSQCRVDSEFLVLNYLTKDDIAEFVTSMKDLFNHLGHIRKGFYCGLCSVRNQKFFDTETKKAV